MTRAELIAALEAATGPTIALSRDVARFCGWFRVAPRFHKGGGWISPQDFLGADDDGRPGLDSLHGTEIHRDPPHFTASIDAALTLVPEGREAVVYTAGGADVWHATAGMHMHDMTYAATPAVALCIAALKAQGDGA
jgi:hypothetical protein